MPSNTASFNSLGYCHLHRTLLWTATAGSAGSDNTPPHSLCGHLTGCTVTHLVERDVREAVLQARHDGVAAQQGCLAVGDLHLQRCDLQPQRLQLPLRRVPSV